MSDENQTFEDLQELATEQATKIGELRQQVEKAESNARYWKGQHEAVEGFRRTQADNISKIQKELTYEKSLNQHRNRNELECMKQATERFQAAEKELAAMQATINEMELESESMAHRFDSERQQASQLWANERAEHIAKQLYLTETINELQAWKLQFAEKFGIPTGNNNTFIGEHGKSGGPVTGAYGECLGFQSGEQLTTGYNSHAIGYSALEERAGSSYSQAYGQYTGAQSTNVGQKAGYECSLQEHFEKAHKGIVGGPKWHLLLAVERLAAETEVRLSKLERAFDASERDITSAARDVNQALVECDAATSSLRKQTANGFHDTTIRSKTVSTSSNASTRTI